MIDRPRVWVQLAPVPDARCPSCGERLGESGCLINGIAIDDGPPVYVTIDVTCRQTEAADYLLAQEEKQERKPGDG